MFFPESSPSTPADEVHSLIATARTQHKRLCPTIATFLSKQDHKAAFLNVFARQIELLKSRSQAFEDAHVTVYDKTLLALTRNGKFLESTPAIGFYCEEYLGIRNQTSGHTLDIVKLEETIQVSKILAQGMAWPDTVKAEYTRQSQAAISPPLTERRPSTIEEEAQTPTLESTHKNTVSLSSHNASMEPKLARLWSVYDQARTDYAAVAARSDSQAINAAKFLRDTAENTIEYLKNKTTDPVMMAELDATYNKAKSVVVILTGGRKRRFDLADVETARGPLRAPRASPGNNRHARDSNAEAYARRAAARCDETGEQHGGYSRSNRGGRGSMARGRGHSGVPFGYTRLVDSYHPY